MLGTKDLTTGKITSLLMALSLPILGTSFIQMAYGLINMAWVGRLGTEAVAAVGAVSIILWMTNSIAILSKVGSEVCVGQSVGVQDEESIRGYASHNLTIALLFSIVWSVLLFLFAEQVISLYKLESAVAADAIRLLRIVSFAFPCVFLNATFTGLYNAAGHSKIPFYTNGTGLVLNVVLDPLFIYVFEWGVDGSAWATLTAQIVVCVTFIYRMKKRNPILPGLKFFSRLNKQRTLRIIRIGLPVSILNTLFSVISLLLARTASVYGGHLGVMALSAGGQIEGLAWNTSQGFSTALSAFVAQNFAAQKKERVLKAFYSTLKIASSIGFICMLLFFFEGEAIFSLIVPDADGARVGGQFLRIDSYSMMFMMLEISLQGFFYGTGRTIPPAIVSVSFNLLRIPLAILLASSGLGISGVWWAVSLTSIAKGIVLLIWFWLSKNRILYPKSV